MKLLWTGRAQSHAEGQHQIRLPANGRSLFFDEYVLLYGGSRLWVELLLQGYFVLGVPGQAGHFIFMADMWDPDNLGSSRQALLPVSTLHRLSSARVILPDMQSLCQPLLHLSLRCALHGLCCNSQEFMTIEVAVPLLTAMFH